MREIAVDVAVVGAGTAGLTARRSAEKAGARVVLIDPGPLGTTCARVGCMPSKLLIAAADAAHHARSAGVFGVDAQVVVDGRRVMARVRQERDRFVRSVLEPMDAIEQRGELLRGAARFVDPHTLAVGEDTVVRARAIVLATGSSDRMPLPYQHLGEALLSSAQLFELEDLPKRVLVVGAGAIGLELGQALHRLGVVVTIVSNNGRAGRFRDPALQRAALDVLGRELDLQPQALVDRCAGVPGGVQVEWLNPDGSRHRRIVDRILLAAGRTPNVQGLALDRAGIPLDEHGRPRAEPTTQQVGGSHVFLAGDVAGHRPILHEAADEGHIAGDNAARWPEVQPKPRRVHLDIVFTRPEMAIVGAPWNELDCDDDHVGEVDWGRQGRAQVEARNAGLLRVYASGSTGVIRGAEMLGPDAEHIGHLLGLAVERGLTVTELLAMPFYHPVVEEGLRTALLDLRTRLRLARPPGAGCEEVGPGA